MILNGNEIENNTILDSDICIVGSGPASITVALELQKTRKKIIIVAGGEWNETSYFQDLNRGIVSLNCSHEPLEENRRRQFGGGSAVWGGRCIPLDPIDFEKRDWIPYSGWPFSYDDLVTYYVKATELCKAGNFAFNAQTVFPDKQKEIIPGMDDEDIYSWPMERWSPPINFAKYYKKTLEDASNIRVLLNTSVTFINSVKKKEIIDSVTAVCSGKQFKIKAGIFVLATGGIENARILLASKSEFHPNGIGNNADNVGRFYMSHINGTFAELDIFNRNNFQYNFEKDKDVYTRRRWWISEMLQKKERIGNIIMFLDHPGGLNGHRDALFSSVFLAKTFLSILRQKSRKKGVAKYKQLKPAIIEHSKNVLYNGFSLIPQIISLGKKRFAKRRLPVILPSLKSKYLGLYYQSEHMPNPESRITLSTENFDALGVPRAVVNIAFTDLDINTIVKAHQVFLDKYSTLKVGNLVYDENKIHDYIKSRIKSFNSIAHHLGTTRIAELPQHGVVDKNAKVFGIDNLYIAGSSIFPTGGHANPTLTIVALSVKLADYLKKILM